MCSNSLSVSLSSTSVNVHVLSWICTANMQTILHSCSVWVLWCVLVIYLCAEFGNTAGFPFHSLELFSHRTACSIVGGGGCRTLLDSGVVVSLWYNSASVHSVIICTSGVYKFNCQSVQCNYNCTYISMYSTWREHLQVAYLEL